MKIKKDDFIEVEYTAIIKEGNIVFDTTNEDIAKRNNLKNDNVNFKPAIICVGQNQLLPAIDKSFEGKSEGDSYKIELNPEQAFGKKDSDMIQFMPTKSFTEHNIMPAHGLHVNVDGILGVVRVVSGGRTLVDFNHPLAGKDVLYEISIKRIVTDRQEKLKSLLGNVFSYEPEIEIKDNTAIVSLKEDIQEKEPELHAKVKELIPEITTIKFNHKKGN